MQAQQSKFLASINSITNDGLDGSEGGEEACPSDIEATFGEPTQDVRSLCHDPNSKGSIYCFGGLQSIGRREVQKGHQRKLVRKEQVRLPTDLRTVRGMMYYRKALELQAFLYMAKDEGVELNMEDRLKKKGHCGHNVKRRRYEVYIRGLMSQYGIDKRSEILAQDILRLMTTYSSLCVAYIDEVEEPSKDASKKINHKVYYSELVKVALPKSTNSSEAVQNLDQVKTKALF
ncbi:Callose synthase 3 [Camellia lanceoleosa]|nr:Callose synthase 3 [Camellia lanceoleosa]